MAKWHPSICRECGTTEGPISARGHCIDCAVRKQVAHMTQMVDKDGPVYNTWREAMIELAENL